MFSKSVFGIFLLTISCCVCRNEIGPKACLLDPVEPEDCDVLGLGTERACIKVEATFDTNCKCVGWETSRPGPGPRVFEVTCNSGTNRQTCSYGGNPHYCSWYNNNNQVSFYEQLLTVIGPNVCQFGTTCPNRSDGYFVERCGDCPSSNFKLTPNLK